MKRIDFEHGTVTGNILGAALPMLVAQILNLLYNIVDRVYIARIPEVGNSCAWSSWTMLSIDCNYQCICQSVWNWWCTAFFYIQREERGNKSSWCNEYIIFTGMRQCYSVDDDRTCICTSDCLCCLEHLIRL